MIDHVISSVSIAVKERLVRCVPIGREVSDFVEFEVVLSSEVTVLEFDSVTCLVVTQPLVNDDDWIGFGVLLEEVMKLGLDLTNLFYRCSFEPLLTKNHIF